MATINAKLSTWKVGVIWARFAGTWRAATQLWVKRSGVWTRIS